MILFGDSSERLAKIVPTVNGCWWQLDLVLPGGALAYQPLLAGGIGLPGFGWRDIAEVWWDLKF